MQKSSVFFILLKSFFLKNLGGFEWDIYKISFEDLEKESLNNSLELDFIDSKLIKLSKQFENSKSKCFNWFYLTLFKNMRKFRTLGTYDYFNEREEIEKNQGKKYQKYFWKTKENLNYFEISFFIFQNSIF